jgi:hypothetical protein
MKTYKRKLSTIIKRAAGALTLGAALAGCTTVQGQTYEGNHKVFTASAYTLGSCQAKLDNEAGQHVPMTQHLDQPLMSFLNLAITSAFICEGAVE